MHIRSVKIANVRGFGEVDLDLKRADGNGCAGWTVVAGRNGSGKTTLLQAIAIWLAPLNPDFELLEGGWVRRGAPHAEVESRIVAHPGDRFDPGLDPQVLPHNVEALSFIEAVEGGRDEMSWNIVWPADDPRGPGTSDGAGSKWSFTVMDAGPTSGLDGNGWFVAAYGPYRRLAGESREGHAASRSHRSRAAFSTLFREDAALSWGVEALQRNNYTSLSGEEPQARRDSARVLEHHLFRLLNSILRDEGVEVLGVGPSGIRVRRGGAEALLHELSDGYRTVVAFAVDLIMRMHAAFGDRLRVEAGAGGVSVPHAGVVLIDEAEEHLHPSWQRRIGFTLKRHFPQVQFIVTTHSPFVCQAADLIVRLYQRPGEDAWSAVRASEKTHAAVVNGTIDDAVLSDLFGLEQLYTDRTDKLRDEVAELEVKVMRGKATAEEERRYHELVEKLPSNDTSAIEQSLRKLAKMP